jgi:ATP-dependent helicase/nuclease subunit A
MSDLVDHPQNPYKSFVVRASAGSGKTYQLSRRFICLVAAGADPGRILTVSFTRKAATEMAQRILSDAAAILREPDSTTELAEWLTEWHKSASAALQLPEPLDLRLAAERIIANSGRLQISTIDSLLFAWLCQYPRETADSVDSLQASPAPQLISSFEAQSLLNRAWNKFVQKHLNDWQRLQQRSAFFERFGINGLRRLVFELLRYESLLWINRQTDSDTVIPWSTIRSGNEYRLDNGEFFLQIGQALSDILPLINAEQQDSIRSILAAQDWMQFMSAKLISKSQLSISGTYLKGKKRESVMPQIETVEKLIRSRVNQERFDLLDENSGTILDAYLNFAEEFTRLKSKGNQVEFSDLIKCGYDLILKPENLAARILIQSGFDHLMLDEFQDTSQVQWRIFDELISEVLSGLRALHSPNQIAGTVFIVGDEKQSIYGFRDADPTVMEDASQRVEHAGGSIVQLSSNFRSAGPILNLVNRVFTPIYADFPEHSSAKNHIDNRPFIPGDSYFGCHFPSDEDLQNLKTQEARRLWLGTEIADRIAKMLDHQKPFLIFDHRLNQMRPAHPGDIAILYRASTGTSVIAQKLRELSIPVHQEESADFLSYQDIRDALSLIRLSVVPHDLLCLSEVLRSPWVGMNDQDYLHWASGRNPDPWLRLEQQFPFAHQRLRKLVGGFELLPVSRAVINAMQLSDYVGIIQQESGCDTANEVEARLRTLLEVIRMVESRGKSTAWDVLRAIDELGQGDQTPKVAAASNSVRMMTIHKSKGLEFPVVILIGTEDAWDKSDIHWQRVKPKTRLATLFYVGNQDDQPIDDSYFEAIRRMMQQSLAEESTRLLYVAMTRARYSLLTFSAVRPSILDSTNERPTFFDRIYSSLVAMATDQSIPCEMNRSESKLELQYLSEFETSAVLTTPKQNKTPVAAVSVKPKHPTHSDCYGLRTLRPSMTASRDAAPESAHHSAQQVSDSTPPSGIDSRRTGIFLHRCIEQMLKREPVNEEKIWHDVFGCPADPDGIDFKFAYSTWQRIRAHQIWDHLSQGAERIRSEMPILMRKSNEILRGSIDLLIEYQDQSVRLFDHKFSDASAEELRASYEGQLIAYHQAASAIFQSSRITAEILQLPSCQLIRIV